MCVSDSWLDFSPELINLSPGAWGFHPMPPAALLRSLCFPAVIGPAAEKQSEMLKLGFCAHQHRNSIKVSHIVDQRILK